MNMGERLKELRLKKGATQEEVGKIINVTKPTIMKYEKGLVENLKRSSIEKLAKYFDVAPSYLMCLDENEIDCLGNPVTSIPILGTVKAGYDYLAQENWIGTIDVETSLVGNGNEYFALKVHGDSMSPVLIEDDIVIIKKQNDFENGDIVVAIINGNEATIKKGKKSDSSILLQPLNSAYEPLIFTKEEMKTIPVTIIGIVKQLKREF
jgi:repressor LexA